MPGENILRVVTGITRGGRTAIGSFSPKIR